MEMQGILQAIYDETNHALRFTSTAYAPQVTDWTTGRVYVVGELVANAGVLYRTTTAHTAGVSFDSTKFTAISAGRQALAEVVLSVDTATIEVAVPAGHRHIQLTASLRTTAAGTGQDIVNLRFNNDATAVYDNIYDLLSNATATVTRSAGANQITLMTAPNDGSAANRFSATDLVVHDYTKTDRDKVVQGRSSTFHNTTTADNTLKQGMGQWRPATPAAITTITLIPNTAAGFKAGSRIAIYGLDDPLPL